MTQKLKLGTYPYTYARVSVMKSTLLQREDYHRLLKMGLNEMINFLQESNYRQEISELAIQVHGVDLMERALNKNLENTFDKLRHISKKALLNLINVYLLRYDIQDIKTILRGKSTGLSAEQINPMLIAAGNLSRSRLEDMAQRETIQDVLKIIGRNALWDVRQAIADFDNSGDLGALESELDKKYFQYTLEFAGTIPTKGKLFREFLEHELAIINILMVLRLKRAGVENQQVKDSLVSCPSNVERKLLKLIDGDIADAPDVFANTEYEELLREGIADFKETKSLIKVETLLYSQVLRRTMQLTRRSPLSVDTILGFMFAKEMEVRNLKMILRGRQLNVDDAFIESQLVMRNG